MPVRHTSNRRAGLFPALATLLTLGSGIAHSTPAASPEYQVKAVFLFNFAHFVEWPPQSFEDPASPFVIGVLGTDPFGSALEGAVRGETIDGRSFAVVHYRSVTEVQHCQILFIGRSEAGRIEEISATLAARSILTVSDREGSAQRGAMIGFVSESNRIRLRIDADAAKDAGLLITYKLLRPAELVKPGD